MNTQDKTWTQVKSKHEISVSSKASGKPAILSGTITVPTAPGDCCITDMSINLNRWHWNWPSVWISDLEKFIPVLEEFIRKVEEIQQGGLRGEEHG